MIQINFEIKSLNKETLLHYKFFLVKILNIQGIKTSCFFFPKKNKKNNCIKIYACIQKSTRSV
jgi:hypothetical protein